jgi:hypothetical protein
MKLIGIEIFALIYLLLEFTSFELVRRLSLGSSILEILRMFRWFVPRKLGWRTHWGASGPLAKDATAHSFHPMTPLHADERRMSFYSSLNWKGHFQFMAFMYCFLGPITAILFALVYFSSESMYVDFGVLPVILATTIFTLSIFVGVEYIKKSKFAEPGPEFIFDRELGVVHIPRIGRLEGGVYLFKDVEGYYYRGTGQYGLRSFFRIVIHHPDKETVVCSFFLGVGSVSMYYDAEAHWTRLCQYMDKTKPLPNMPQLWGTLAPKLMGSRGWSGRAGYAAAVDELSHEYALYARAYHYQHDIDVAPHVDPISDLYEGPRSYQYYKWLYSEVV